MGVHEWNVCGVIIDAVGGFVDDCVHRTPRPRLSSLRWWRLPLSVQGTSMMRMEKRFIGYSIPLATTVRRDNDEEEGL
jgi:hypothetical protein